MYRLGPKYDPRNPLRATASWNQGFLSGIITGVTGVVGAALMEHGVMPRIMEADTLSGLVHAPETASIDSLKQTVVQMVQRGSSDWAIQNGVAPETLDNSGIDYMCRKFSGDFEKGLRDHLTKLKHNLPNEEVAVLRQAAVETLKARLFDFRRRVWGK